MIELTKTFPKFQIPKGVSNTISQTYTSTKKLNGIIRFAIELKYLQSVKKLSARELGIFTRDRLTVMGATFIKIGQLLSTRTDLLDKDFANELEILQDNLPPFDVELYRNELEKSCKSLILYQLHRRPLDKST